MTPHHHRVGSTTKTFTAVVAQRLVGEGRLRLETAANRWGHQVAGSGRGCPEGCASGCLHSWYASGHSATTPAAAIT